MLIRGKCVFTSEDLPCDFCQQYRGGNSCIKIAAQPHSSRISLWRVREEYDKLPSLASAVMRHESPLWSLIEHFNIDTQSEPFWYSDTECLGWAVLAWRSRQCAPSECKKQLSDYLGAAVKSLNTAIGYVHIFDKSVFASNLIAWVAYSSCADKIDPHAHFKHSLAILNFLSEQTKTRNLEIFGPFIIDCANAWTIRNGAIPLKCTTFRQRTEYFDHLRVADAADTWYSGILEAANSTLGNLLEVSLTSVCEIITKEVEYDFTRDTVKDVLQYIRAELGDVDLHQALTTLNQFFQGSQTNHASVEGQLITRIFHRLRCVLLLQSVLEAPTVETGVRSPKARFIAEKIIIFCRKRAIDRDGPIEDYYLISWHNFSHLLLGGMGLLPQESPERKFLRIDR